MENIEEEGKGKTMISDNDFGWIKFPAYENSLKELLREE